MRRIALATALVAVTITGPVHAAAPTCGGEPATIVGTAGPDVLVGTPGRDVMVGLAGADELRGRGGDDLLCGNGGRDVLRGGSGADLLDVGPDERGDADVVSYDTAEGGVEVDLPTGSASGQGRDQIVGTSLEVHGSPHDDQIVGFPETPNRLVGAGGDDRLTGGTAGDVIFGDADRSTPERGDDIVYGGAGADALYGGPGDDQVSGGTGDDFLYAWPQVRSGSDWLFGGPGRDWIEDVVGPGERDQWIGAGGDDSLWVRTRFMKDGRVTHPDGRMELDGRWTTFGKRQARGKVRYVNQVILPIGAWTLIGTSGDEKLEAPRGVTDPRRRGVTIRGRGGDDVLIGSEYDDVLVGGGGTDEACGRGGDDEIDAEAQAVDVLDLCESR